MSEEKVGGESRLLKGVAYYPGLGWKILPCHGIVNGRCTCSRPHGEPKEVGKHPVINQWNSASTSDIDIITDWWKENPDYNIGVHCSKSGFFVIDIDPRSGGPESFEKFEEMVPGGLPKTVEAVTGAYTGVGGVAVRGRHLFYSCDPEEGLIGNLNNLGLKGVDIKHNGYVLISPSHHFSGVTYEWAPGHAPWEIDMAEAPEELLDILRKRRRTSSLSLEGGDWGWIRDVNGLDYEKILREGVEEGERAVTLHRLACHLANKYGTDDMSAQFVETYMIRFNHEMVRPPMDLEGTNGLLQHVRNGIKYIRENPKKGSYRTANVEEWQKTQAEKMHAETREKPPQPAPMLGVILPARKEIESFFDSAQEESSRTPENNLEERAPWRIGRVVDESIRTGSSISEATSLSNIDVPKDVDALSEADGGFPGSRSLSDVGNGRRLVDTFGTGVRYTSGLGWFVWRNGYWKPDVEDSEVQEEAKKLAPLISAEVVNYDAKDQGEVIKWAAASRTNGRIRAAVESAKTDPRIKVDVDSWDKEPNLLGVRNGVVDLRTGELLQGMPELHITRRAPVSYTRGHRNVRWENFLDEATQGDKETQEWLQKAAGYSLSGSNMYDILFLVYGPPGSGKNTFVEALVKVLGTKQYAWPLDSTILAQTDGVSSQTDMYHWAQLRGRRMVWIDELPDSERIKENAVKKLTGSSEISARSPGEQPFVFQSQAKLWISTNNRPIITDDAMWRRIRPIPFDYKPPIPDPKLKEYIFDPEGALPAVLSWAVEGAVKIFNSLEVDALGWCPVVRNAAELYQRNEDRIGLFLGEETEQRESSTLDVKHLYARYKNWALDRSERPLSQIAFQRKLADRGVRTEGAGSRAIVIGYYLKTSAGLTDFGFLSEKAATISEQ
jgi:P4 family phage/plasmid primase-like protien